MVKWRVKNAVSEACLRMEEEALSLSLTHTHTHRCMHANTHAHAPPASRYAGDLVPF